MAEKKQQNDLRELAKAVDKMSETAKAQLIGYAKGMADAAEIGKVLG